MFDIAWTEILVVAVIAIIVVGPKELPGMLRAFGKTFGQVRRTAREFQSTFNDALREAERQANLDEVRKDIDSVRSMDPTKELRKGLDDTKRQLSGKIDAGKTDTTSSPKPDVVPLKNADPAATEPARPQPAAEMPAADPAPASSTSPADDGEAPRAAAVGSER